MLGSRKIHIVGGAAGIGRWLVAHVFRDAYIYDVKFLNTESLPTTAKKCLVTDNDYGIYADNFAPADWILFAVPLTVFDSSLMSLLPFLKEQSLVVTLSSVQEEPIRILKERIPISMFFCGCHPLFGHTVPSPAGQIVALTEFDEKHEQHRLLRSSLVGIGLITTLLDPATHDRYMAQIQALTHFCLLGFAAALSATGSRPEELLKLRTPNFQFLYAFASRVVKQSSTTTGAIQSTTAASGMRRAFLACLGSLHSDLEAAEKVAEHATVIERLRSPLTGSEIDEGAAVAEVAVESIQRFEDLLHRYRLTRSPFLFRRRRDGALKIVRILEIHHDNVVYEESHRIVVDDGVERSAIGLNQNAIENYRRLGIAFPPSLHQSIKKRNIKLIAGDEVERFYKDKLLPITVEYSVSNPLGYKEEYFEEWLPLVVKGLWRCEFKDAFRPRLGTERVLLKLTFNPNTNRDDLIDRVRSAVEDRQLPKPG